MDEMLPLEHSALEHSAARCSGSIPLWQVSQEVRSPFRIRQPALLVVCRRRESTFRRFFFARGVCLFGLFLLVAAEEKDPSALRAHDGKHATPHGVLSRPGSPDGPFRRLRHAILERGITAVGMVDDHDPFRLRATVRTCFAAHPVVVSRLPLVPSPRTFQPIRCAGLRRWAAPGDSPAGSYCGGTVSFDRLDSTSPK